MYIRSLFKTIIFCAIVVFLQSIFTQQAHASNYAVTPLAFNLDLEKRDIVAETIILTNNSDKLVRLYATVNEVSMDGDGVVESFQSPARADRTATPTSWVEISRQRIELQPKEVREIPFTIRMNPDAQPGEYNVFLGFAEASNAPQAQAKVSKGGQPGSLLYISVDKEQNVFLRLEKFVVDKFITEEKGGSVSYILKNPGSIDVVPKGEMIFYDNNGEEVAAVPLNTGDMPVAGEKSARFDMPVPNQLGIGKYKAFLSVEYGEHLTASVHDTAYFYVVPIKQLIIIFVLLMLFAIFVALYVHRRYDVPEGVLDYEQVPMYVKSGTSENQHHDIDLKNKE